MKISYFELLSPEPVYIQKAIGVISPKLKDIASIGINIYQYYLSVLLMDLKTYFTMIGKPEQAELLTETEKAQISIYDLLTLNSDSIKLLQAALNFFIKEEVAYSVEHKCFLVKKNTPVPHNGEISEEASAVGSISRETYPQVCDIICQRNFIKSSQQDDLSKAKNRKAVEIMKKLQKGRDEKAKHTKADKNMELGNIISAVANKSQSLNILNIWDLTVYQVWDCFQRLSSNNIYNIQSMSVAAWGNKDNQFDAASWFKRTDNGN